MPAILLLIALLAAANIGATEPCEKKLDVAIVVDSSSSICNGNQACLKWNSVIQFIKDIVDSLTIGQNDSRVALIKMSDGIKVEWNFNGYTDKNTLLSAIDRVVYSAGEISNLLSAGIFFTDVFNPDFGDRPDVSTVIIAITDGIPLIDPGKAAAFSNALQKNGIKVLVVCLPGCSECWAKSVTSEPKQITNDQAWALKMLEVVSTLPYTTSRILYSLPFI